MKKLKAIFQNPLLLGVQGFAAGALLLWSTNEPPQLPPPATGASMLPASPSGS